MCSNISASGHISTKHKYIVLTFFHEIYKIITTKRQSLKVNGVAGVWKQVLMHFEFGQAWRIRVHDQALGAPWECMLTLVQPRLKRQ